MLLWYFATYRYFIYLSCSSFYCFFPFFFLWSFGEPGNWKGLYRPNWSVFILTQRKGEWKLSSIVYLYFKYSWKHGYLFISGIMLRMKREFYNAWTWRVNFSTIVLNCQKQTNKQSHRPDSEVYIIKNTHITSTYPRWPCEFFGPSKPERCWEGEEPSGRRSLPWSQAPRTLDIPTPLRCTLRNTTCNGGHLFIQ